jgi:hypothetical protein
VFEFVLRKLGLLSVNIQNYAETALEYHIESSGRALPEELFSRLKLDIADRVRNRAHSASSRQAKICACRNSFAVNTFALHNR